MEVEGVTSGQSGDGMEIENTFFETTLLMIVERKMGVARRATGRKHD